MHRSSYHFRFVFLLLCISTCVYGRTADSLVTLPITPYNSTNNVDSVIAISKRTLDSCSKTHDADGAFMALIAITIKYYEKEDYPMVRYYAKQAIPWAEKSTIKDAVAWAYGNIADAYTVEGDYTKALENLYIALAELNKRTKEVTHVTANIYNNFAVIHLRLNEIPKAMAYYDLATNAAIKGDLFFQLGNTYTDKGEYYLSIHQTDSAVKYFNKIMEIGRKRDKADLQATAYADLGKVFIETKEYDKAINNLQSAIAIARYRYNYIITNASFSLIDAWMATGKYKDALAMGLALAKANERFRLGTNYMKAYTKLTAIYKAMGNTTAAMASTDTMLLLKDQVTATEKAKAISNAETKYKAAEQEKKLAQNQLLIVRQQSKIVSRNIWIAAISIGIGVMVLLSLFLYINARNKRRIHEQRVTVLEREKTISTLKGMVQGADTERTRIARDLHDGIGGLLSAAIMRISGVPRDNPEMATSPRFVEAMNLLNKTGEEIRKTAHNLMPEVLLKQNLTEVIAGYCNVLSSEKLIVDFQSFGAINDLPKDVKLNLYRIIQELLENIVKHAQATQAIVQLQLHDRNLTLTVEDNGVGFDTHAMEGKTGIGLGNIDVRVNSMDGKMEIDSAPGKGVSVYIEFDMAIIDGAANREPENTPTHEN